MIPILFFNYDLMLTKIRNLENQEFLSCCSAATSAGVESASAAAAAQNGKNGIQ